MSKQPGDSRVYLPADEHTPGAILQAKADGSGAEWVLPVYDLSTEREVEQSARSWVNRRMLNPIQKSLKDLFARKQ